MLIAVVDDHVGLLLQATHRDVELDALIPRYGTVVVVGHEEHRRRDAIKLEQRRILHEALWILPERSTDAALRMLVLERARHARGPANSAIGRRHVHDGGVRHGGGEHVGHRDEIRRLVSAPRLSGDADPLGIDEALGDEGLHPRDNRLGRARARLPIGVHDVGLEHDVAEAVVHQRIDGIASRGRDVVVQSVREFLVEVHDHRVLFRRIEILRLVQQSAQRNTVAVQPRHQFDGAARIL